MKGVVKRSETGRWIFEFSKVFPALLLSGVLELIHQSIFPGAPFSVKFWLIVGAFIFWLGFSVPAETGDQ